jgi:hypothetical protein
MQDPSAFQHTPKAQGRRRMPKVLVRVAFGHWGLIVVVEERHRENPSCD